MGVRLRVALTSAASPPQYKDAYQWLQVELPTVTKITGIVTQGAKALGKQMYVTSYSLQYSDNGIHWTHYTDAENVPFKVSGGGGGTCWRPQPCLKQPLCLAPRRSPETRTTATT